MKSETLPNFFLSEPPHLQYQLVITLIFKVAKLGRFNSDVNTRWPTGADWLQFNLL